MDDRGDLGGGVALAYRSGPGGRLGGGGGIPLGRVFGAPVRLRATWLLLAALVIYSVGRVILAGRPDLPVLVGYGVGAAFVVAFVGSVLLHELGHAVVARRYGLGVRQITLEALGGHTELEREPSRPGVELAVSMAGPAASLAVAVGFGVLAGVLPAGSLAGWLAAQLAVGNLVVAVFNALPGLPLDGGRALLAVVWAVSGNPGKGRRVAGWSGRLVAAGTALIALRLYLVGAVSAVGMVVLWMVAYPMWVGAGQSIKAAAFADRVAGLAVRRLVRPIVAVSGEVPLGVAERRVAQLGVAGAVIAVADPLGRVVGLVHQEAAARVPAERREAVAVAALTRAVPPEAVVALELRGVEVLRAVGRDPGGDYLVVSGEDVVGVLRGADVTSSLESDGLVLRKAVP